MKSKLTLLSFVIAGLMTILSCLARAEAENTKHKVTAQEFVNLQQGKVPHKGYRRAHAKGICIEGEFQSNGNLAKYTSAPLFALGAMPFTGRFSVAGNDPHGADLKAPVRSFALNFALAANDRWRIAMNTPPVMAVKNPQDFYAQLVAIKQGGDAISAFFHSHPESKDFLNWQSQYTPANSFSGETYHSINAFYLHNGNTTHAVRWNVIPDDAADIPKTGGNDALQTRLIAQLGEQPVIFDWQFQLASDEDDPTNPAVKWPDSRETVSAGKLVITGWKKQLDGNCHSVNFDPNILPVGISASDDPILKARSAAYAESYKRRALEVFDGALEGEQHDQ